MWKFPSRQGCQFLPILFAFIFNLSFGPTRAAAELDEQLLRGTGWVLVPQGPGSYRCGTCCLVDAERGLALTNAHVIGEGRGVGVYVPVHLQSRLITDSGYYLRGLMPVPAHVV